MNSNPVYNYWTVESFDDAITANVILETKECKKRKEFYEVAMPSLLYKNPYKLHMRAKWINGMHRPADMNIRFSVVFEDMTPIPIEQMPFLEVSEERKGHLVVFRNEEYIEVKSFWFNVTSYHNKGRRFKLIVELFHELTDEVAVRYFSQPLVIRAKRPIVKPGSRKRKADFEEPETRKRQSLTELSDSVDISSSDSSSSTPAQSQYQIHTDTAPYLNTFVPSTSASENTIIQDQNSNMHLFSSKATSSTAGAPLHVVVPKSEKADNVLQNHFSGQVLGGEVTPSLTPSVFQKDMDFSTPQTLENLNLFDELKTESMSVKPADYNANPYAFLYQAQAPEGVPEHMIPTSFEYEQNPNAFYWLQYPQGGENFFEQNAMPENPVSVAFLELDQLYGSPDNIDDFNFNF